MKKFLILILGLFTPFANSDVVKLDVDIDRNQNMEYQIVCITNNSSQREGYQYLVAQRLIKGVGSRVFINLELPPVIVQMYEKSENGETIPISCKR